MAEIVPGKSRGMKFAEQQLLRHGWVQGKGLGRDENGISEAIKVKVKCDKDGIGHKKGEQFTFQWWDHVFNKASNSLQVESDQNGVTVKKTVEDEEEGMISNKKPRKAALYKGKLYGCFVKSATLLSGQEQPEPKSSDDSSSSDDDDDEDQQLDLSSTNKLTDTDLMKACGGRTAHKGARHGLNMSAKLARLEQQEAEFMAKYGKKNQSANASPECTTPTTQSAAQSPERREETTQASHSKKMKRKKSSQDFDEHVTELNGGAVSEHPKMDASLKKMKKKKKENSKEAGEEIREEVSPVDNGEEDRSQVTKRKHKKSEKNREENRDAGETTAPTLESEGVTMEASSEQQTDSDTTTKKKKKKKSKERREPVAPAEVEEHNFSRSEPAQNCLQKNKKKKKSVTTEGGGVVEEEYTAKQKRKKCKEDRRPVEDRVNEEVVHPKKKRKKSKE
ncbi:G patch domain-containing protein 4 [Polymixia lowei]